MEKQRFKWMFGKFLMGDKNEEAGNPFYSTYKFKYPFTICVIDADKFA